VFGWKRVYCIAAGVIVLCVCLSVYLFADSISTGSVSDDSDVPQASVNPDQALATNTTATEAPSNSTNLNNTLLTEEQALAIAMPIIEQYATEHNRTIANVTTTFALNARDTSGVREGPSMTELLKEDISIVTDYQWPTYPMWYITAHFEGTQEHILSYYISIYADNGQIQTSQEQGFF
jgi:hypothetical protein